MKEEECSLHIITDNPNIKEATGRGVSYLGNPWREIPFVTIGFGHDCINAYGRRLEGGWKRRSFVGRCGRMCGEKLSENGKRFYAENSIWLKNVKRIHICGAGIGQGIAQECALKFCETLQIAATSYETEEFLHGGFLELEEEHVVFFTFNGKREGEDPNSWKNIFLCYVSM